MSRGLVVITGAIRGVGLETARALARDGFDLVLTYRDPGKQRRANKAVADVISECASTDQRVEAVLCDMTDALAVEGLVQRLRGVGTDGAPYAPVHALVLNASGGLEKGGAVDPYAMNCTAQVAFARAFHDGGLLAPTATIVFLQSHWGYYGAAVPQAPEYEPIGLSKYAGMVALTDAVTTGVVPVGMTTVTAGKIKNTPTVMMLERAGAQMGEPNGSAAGEAVTIAEVVAAVRDAVLNPPETGTVATSVVGQASFDALKAQAGPGATWATNPVAPGPQQPGGGGLDGLQ